MPSKQLEISMQLESEINVRQSRKLLSFILSGAKALSSRNTDALCITVIVQKRVMAKSMVLVYVLRLMQ